MTTVASIDCGTNSTRLLVQRDGADLERRAIITRLGAGVDRSGVLDDVAVERTLVVLRDFRAAMDAHGVERVRIAATSACRDARNRDVFFDAAEAIVGARPELLSGELDAARGPFLVIDIGGGSTEVAYGRLRKEPDVTVSLEVGCVRLTERWISSDPPAPEDLHAAISVTQQHLEDVAREHPSTRDFRTAIGLAGTVTTAAAVEIGLAEYRRERVHHFVLTRTAAEDVFRTLATESAADRVHNPGLQPERNDVIVGGLCALVAFLRYFDVDELLVSESDILDGLARSIA
jgi:exopolyphosphatase/guanosine-5'-triphosphate,3'-diphosphate pyrophosphatase